MHSDNLARSLDSLARRLREEGIPFAVVGALAMRHHGYARYTEDIDILTTPDGLDLIHRNLVGRGYVPKARGLRKRLRDTEFGIDIDILTAGEPAGASGSPVTYPVPTGRAFRRIRGIPIPVLPLLIAFKLASGMWGHRLRDLGDVQELIVFNRLTKSFARRLPAGVRPKFLELLGEAGRRQAPG